MAANAERIPLAKMAVEETRMGVVEDKVIKVGVAWRWNGQRGAWAIMGCLLCSCPVIYRTWNSCGTWNVPLDPVWSASYQVE